MTITVKLFATLRKYLPEDAVNKTATFELDESSTTDDIVEKLKIPDGRVHLILINGKHAERGSDIPEGATVSFFPPVAGG
jgi:molybdopterin synthase sulfur carrier subunit